MSETISPNTTIAQYTIVSKLGEGGMGEVYRARDTKLSRDVAIKVLPASLSENPDRLNRFEQEAQAACALNHPNILVIHHIGLHNGAPYIVSELLEGETLRERMAGGALPQRKATDYALQIAKGLAAAHDKGIVHRDLKPENIFITDDGRVKILDFGLAKLTATVDGNASQTEVPTRKVNTDPGTVMGTVGYMSPEQLKGQPVDHRSDIFSFGAVFYEMLAGKRAFRGDSVAETMSSILREDPPELSETNKTVSPALERVVRHCLEKNPAERFHSARDLGFAIESFSGAVTSDARLEIIETVVGVAEPPKHEETRRLSWSRALPWAIAGLAILIAVTAFYFRKPSPDVSNAGVRQFTLAQPAEGPLDLTFGGSILLSPDGGHLVSSIRAGGKRQLFYRALSSANAQPLDGTQGASDPFFSPDGKWLAFFANGLLKKVSLSGGAPEIICKAQNPRGGVWEKANSVVFTPDTDAPLYRVSAGGGPVQPISALDSSNRERSHRWPDVLPSGKAVVFTAAYEVGNPMDDASIAVLDLSTGKHKTLIKGGSFARYVPTGHLVYARRGALVAIPFDAQTLELKGVPVTVQEELLTTVVNGRAQYSFSRTGDFVYIRDQSTSKANVGQLLDWVDRRGGAKELINVRHEYSAPRLSPDGRTLFVEIADPAAAIWVYDFERGTLSPLTQAGVSYGPIPSPDGRRIAYQATRDGVTGVMMAQSDGTSEERLTSDKRFNFPTSWSPDGKQLLITAANESGYSEVRLLEPDGDRKQRTFLQGPFNTGGAMFSPNGRWVAYVSDESTRNEVYVRSYPETGTRIQVSADGGSQPVWSRNGKELFFRNGDQVLVVSIGLSSPAVVSKPRVLFTRASIDDSSGPAYGMTADYDVSIDGQHFIMRRPNLDPSQAPAARIVLNWFEELNRLTAGSR